MSDIGIMQGRLSPPIDGRIQAFPKKAWREEFPKAAEAGLSLIEWIIEADEWEKNPYFASPLEILDLCQRYRIQILSICADYFMDLPLVRASKDEKQERLAMLEEIISRAPKLGVKYIGIPFVDASAINSDEELQDVVECLRSCLPAAERSRVQLALETSLDPQRFTRLLKQLNHPCVKVNYDIGNSASLGYNTTEEINAYGEWITTIHVKDRKLGGGTVPLGTGDADFDATFAALAKVGYEGPFILQAARDGDEVQLGRRNVEFVRRYLDKYFNASVS